MSSHELKEEWNTFNSATCSICLSVNRKVYPIGNYSEIFRWLVVSCHGQVVRKEPFETIIICWECQAIFKKIKLFQQKMIESYCLLRLEQKPRDLAFNEKSLSTLTHINTTQLNYENVYFDNEYEVPKTEGSNEENEYKDEIFDDVDHLTFTDVLATPKLEIDEKSKDFTKPKNVQRKCRWFEKQAILNKKTKFKIIHIDDFNSKCYEKFIINNQELMEYLASERCNNLKGAHFKCEYCASVFTSEKLYTNHKSENHKKTHKFVCDICQSRFSSKRTLGKHCKNHYYKYKCAQCNYMCYKKNQIYHHWQHRHKRKFECVKCKLGFWSRKDFYEHYKEWHQQFICHHCGVSFKMRYCIKQHLSKKHSSFECKLCDKRFARYNGLWFHNKVKHPQGVLEKAYCVECNKHFDNVYRYKWHLNNSVVHKPRKKVKVPCPSCDKIFSKNIYMKDHYDLVHLKNYKYRCEACDKNFSRNADLAKHRRRVHEGERTPKNKICDFCGRAFSSNKTLTNHVRTHTGEKPFECSLCPARFAQRVALTGHQRNVHTKSSKDDALAQRQSHMTC